MEVWMRSHGLIDERSLALARAIVSHIDADPGHAGLEHARATCARWLAGGAPDSVSEWSVILGRDWPEIRAVLLDDSEDGRRRRQSNPFCGILGREERRAIYKEYRLRDTLSA
jgi:hypothetical protein